MSRSSHYIDEPAATDNIHHHPISTARAWLLVSISDHENLTVLTPVVKQQAQSKMCLTWTRTYTLCGCTHELTTTPCPETPQCAGLKITFLQNNSVTCRECWRSGDKRTLTSGSDADDEHEVQVLPDDPETPAEDSEDELEIWHDAVESSTSSTNTTPASTDESESEDVFIDAFEYVDEYCSPGLESRPETPFLDLDHPEWLGIVDGVDAGRVCRSVERVYPHYRARMGPTEWGLVKGEFVCCLDWLC
jgi:hypothetical protein